MRPHGSGAVGVVYWCFYGSAHCGTEQDRSAKRGSSRPIFDTGLLTVEGSKYLVRGLILYGQIFLAGESWLFSGSICSSRSRCRLIAGTTFLAILVAIMMRAFL